MGHTINTRKVDYIFLLCIFSLDYMYNNAFNIVLTRDVLLVLFLLLTMVGGLIFDNSNIASPLNSYKNRKYIYLTWGLVLVSSLMPVFNGVQGYFSTLLAQRSLLAMLFLMLLLRVCPSEEEMMVILKRLTIISIILGVLSIKWPYLFLNEIQTLSYENRQSSDDTDIINTGIGLKVVVLYYFYKCQNVISNSKIQDITIVCLLLLYFVLVQSRSTLLIVIPIFIFTMLKMHSRHKALIITGLTIVGVVFFYYYAAAVFDGLIEETQSQLTNEGYNRWQAMDFFFFERKFGVADILFGHGVPAAGSSYLRELVDASEDRWAFISDIGMLGVFFYYGALFLSVFYIPFVFKVIWDGRYPFYLKAFSLWVLFVPTIHCYNLPGSTSFVVYYIYMYLVIIHKRNTYCLQS